MTVTQSKTTSGLVLSLRAGGRVIEVSYAPEFHHGGRLTTRHAVALADGLAEAIAVANRGARGAP